MFPADIPLGEGLQVLVTGLVGVFTALALLAGGIKLVSVVVSRFEKTKEN